MALTLAQAAPHIVNEHERAVTEIFVQESPVLANLPLKPIGGNSFTYNQESALPGVAFRNVNEGYVESTGVVNPQTETIKILGGDADVDAALIAFSGGDTGEARATQERMKIKALSYQLQDAFFNGDVVVDPKGIDGLRKRLVGAQVLDNPNGIPVVGPALTDTHAFFDKLDDLLSAVPGINGDNGALFANRSILGKIRGAGRRVAGVNYVEDQNGKRVVTWQGVPILDAGSNAAGASVLAQTETRATGATTTANDASSVYAVKFGEDYPDAGVTGLVNTTPVGDSSRTQYGVRVKDLGEIAQAPLYRTRIEMYVGVALFGGKAAARLKGVLNA